MRKFIRLLITGAAASAVMIPVAVSADTNIDETTFPDATFRQYVTETFDKDSNNVLSDAEISDAKDIFMVSSNNSTLLYYAKSMGADLKELKDLKEFDAAPIRSFEGVQYLTNLNNFAVFGNTNVTSIDLSANKALKAIVFIEKLNLNILTGSIDGGSTHVSSIVTKNNPNLEVVAVTSDSLKDLDLKSNNKLTTLYVGNSRGLKKVDISSNKNLNSLVIDNCGVKSVNVKKNKKLENLSISSSPVSKIDLGKNKNLKSLSLIKTKIKKVNLKKNKKLTTINVSGSKIKKLDLSKNKKLTSVTADKNVKIKGYKGQVKAASTNPGSELIGLMKFT